MPECRDVVQPVRSFNGVLVATTAQSPPGPPGPKGDPGVGSSDLTYTAGAVISGETALEFAPDGTVVPANPTQQSGWVYAGIALGAAQIGASVAVRFIGDIAAPWWSWVFGMPVFAGANGALTQVPPTIGFSQIVGRATSPTSIRLVDEDVIFLEGSENG